MLAVRGEAVLGHYLLTFYRSLTRQWLYAALNLVGLAVGIAIFLVLMLDLRFETSFDDWIPDAANIYRITSTYTFPGRPPDRLAGSSGAIALGFRADYPRTGNITRLLDSKRVVANGPLLGSEHMDYVDANFFDVLDLPLVAGDRRTALADPDDVVITEAVARKYLGTTAVLGRSLTLYYRGKPHLHRITGVLRDIPVNSHLKIAVVAPLTPALEHDPATGMDMWGAAISFTYVRFASAAQARAVAADLPRFVQRRAHEPGDGATSHIDRILRLSLVPLRDLHFADAHLVGSMKAGVDERLVYALGLVGALTLAIAVLNYVNLATARSALRAKEIALRKVMGATRAALMVQLLAEAVAFALAAVLLGVALAELSLPLVNTLGGGSLALSYWGTGSVVPWVLVLAVAIGLGAGLYPALMLSRFEPAPVLAAARSPGGGRGEARVRGVLIGAQFVVAIAFIVCTLVIGSQARFIREADRGFRRDGLILLDSVGAWRGPQQNQLLDALRAIPGVVSATASWREPGQPYDQWVCVQKPGAPGETLSFDLISDDYLKTYGAQLAAGRMFDHAHGADDVAGPFKGDEDASSRGVDVMLNESAARTLGFADPARAVGQRVIMIDDQCPAKGEAVPVIGVLRDIHFDSPQHPVAAVVYRYDSQPFMTIAVAAVRFAGVSNAVMMARLRAEWRREAPMTPFQGKTAEESLSDYYVPDEQRARLFTVGSLLAVGIGCIGLYGMAAFNTARRFKEIGIRKTLGASTRDILRLLVGQFLRPVLLANIVAWPLAWMAMRGWLAGFDQRISLGPGYFLAATLLTLIIAIGTVAGQAFAVARSDPAEALRNE
jgi:putative ABC transport system permease protein